MTKKYNYVYITTNSINEKQYVGDHSTNNLNDSYLGSGVALHESIKKYGKENFKREILEIFETKQKAYDAQEKYINNYNTLTPNGYNISPKGGLGISKSYHNEETKRKIGKANKISLKGRIRSEVSKIKQGKSIKGKIISEKTKQKLRIINLGKTNPMFGKHISEEHKEILRNSKSFLGKRHSNKSKKQIKNTLKNKPKILCIYCDKMFDKGNYNRWHNEKCKRKKEN